MAPRKVDLNIASFFRDAANMPNFQGHWIADIHMLSALQTQFPILRELGNDTRTMNVAINCAFPIIFSVNGTNTSNIFACKFTLKIDGKRRQVTFFIFLNTNKAGRKVHT